MGNAGVKCCVAGEGVVRVMTAGGQVEEFERPISAGQVMDRHPGYLLLDTTSLQGGENKQTGQVVLDEVTFVASAMALQAGRLYVLYAAPRPTTTNTTPEPEKSLVPHVPAALPHQPVPPDDHRRTVPYQPDVKKTAPSSELEVKKEAAVDVPAVAEPKEEKPKGHGWSPSLSSIPESPATSLRALELPAAAAATTTTTHIYKTPPRHSSNLNQLVKQAILHKHPRSFWR